MSNASHAGAPAEYARLFDLHDTSRTPDRSREAGTVGDPSDRRLIAHAEADPVFVEQNRRLAAALHQAQAQKGIRTVMVASAVAAEGKTLSATNLAVMLSRFGKRVLLVDGDLRKPSVHTLLQIGNGSGLTDILRQPGVPLPLRQLSPTLSVITGGHPDPDPVALLISDAASQLLVAVRARFDWVVVDTPPIVLFPDAGLFADRLDTCVMVVGAATTASNVAEAAVAAVGSERILGVVLNRADLSAVAAGYGYGRYTEPDGRRRRGLFTGLRPGRG